MPPTPTITPKIHFLNQPIVSFQKAASVEPLFHAGCYFYPLFYIHFHKGVIPYAKHRIIPC